MSPQGVITKVVFLIAFSQSKKVEDNKQKALKESPVFDSRKETGSKENDKSYITFPFIGLFPAEELWTFRLFVENDSEDEGESHGQKE